MAEIFGTSDDEEDVDFPFSISSGLPGELSLQNTETKKFGNSLLGNSDSEMFLTHTFHDTLSSMPPVPVTISQSLREMDVQQVNVKEGGGSAAASNNKPKDEASNGKGEELMKTKATNGNEKTSAEEVKPSTSKFACTFTGVCKTFMVANLFIYAEFYCEIWCIRKSFRVNIFLFLQRVNL